MHTEEGDLYRRIEKDREERLRLSLVASQGTDLVPVLQGAIGAVVGGQYRIDAPLAAGSQFFVWSASGVTTGRAVIIKQARIDYRHPVRYGRIEVQRLRNAVRREEEVLWADRTGTLPRVLALIVDKSPVPAAAASALLANEDVFVVEEFIRGLTLTELALQVWVGRPIVEREAAVAQLASEFVSFWTCLHRGGWFYGDLSAENLMIEESGRLRVVDAGSAVPVVENVVLDGFTPAFTCPRVFDAVSKRRPIAGTIASMLPSLSKVLHFALTGREQLNGVLPDLAEPKLQQYSSLCRLVLEVMAEVDRRPERADDSVAALGRWKESTTDRRDLPT